MTQLCFYTLDYLKIDSRHLVNLFLIVKLHQDLFQEIVVVVGMVVVLVLEVRVRVRA